MNIKLIVIGETNNKNLKVLIDQYITKLNHYIKFDLIVIKDQKKKITRKYSNQKRGGRNIIHFKKK